MSNLEEDKITLINLITENLDSNDLFIDVKGVRSVLDKIKDCKCSDEILVELLSYIYKLLMVVDTRTSVKNGEDYKLNSSWINKIEKAVEKEILSKDDLEELKSRFEECLEHKTDPLKFKLKQDIANGYDPTIFIRYSVKNPEERPR